MQECSQLYYNYTILLLNFRRSYRGSTDRSRSLLSRAWNCHQISRSPTTSVNKSRLAFSSLDCRIHSFTFVFLICVLRLNNGLVEYALASLDRLASRRISPTYVLSKYDISSSIFLLFRLWHGQSFYIYDSAARSIIHISFPESRFEVFNAPTEYLFVSASFERTVSWNKLCKQPEDFDFVAGNQDWTLSLYLLLRCFYTFARLDPSFEYIESLPRRRI